MRTDWLWKADQAYTDDTLPDVNLRGMTKSGSKTPKKANPLLELLTTCEFALQLCYLYFNGSVIMLCQLIAELIQTDKLYW